LVSGVLIDASLAKIDGATRLEVDAHYHSLSLFFVGVTFAFRIAGTNSIVSSTKKVLAFDIQTVPPKKGNNK
jgi:hypothetical protein